MKTISILGSTGSIGTQALEIVSANPDRFRISALTCGRNINLLSDQIRTFSPEIAVTEREEDARVLQEIHPGTEILWGTKGLIRAAESSCELLLNSLVGMMGLVPTYHAICKGKDIALANKETLVAGGQLIMDAVKNAGIRLLPVDSEHSAIFQCLQGNAGNPVKRLILTASGGPFRGWTKEQLHLVTLEQALDHPRWTMGPKITVDSATLMNKGLEVIEARWLFDVTPEQIQVAVHPQSIVHSMLEFRDNSILAQLGNPDMRVPIAYAFSWPERIPFQEPGLDLFGSGACLTFEEVDEETFPCLGYARKALEYGDSYPIALNGANEVLVDQFLQGRISFMDIPEKLGIIMEEHSPVSIDSIETILQVDRQIREEAARLAAGV